MNRIKPFFNGSRTEDPPEYTTRVRYIRESCKVFADLYKSDKDFLNKSVENEMSKTLTEFRLSDIACSYGSSSILKSTIDDFIEIHEYIEGKRKKWLEKFRTITEQAREKQHHIRQAIADSRDNYERAVRKYETADSNLKKFQNRDSTTIPNYDERCRELEEIRTECDHARNNARDIYTSETYRIASEEHFITRDYFARYLFDEENFYNDIQKYFSNQIPKIQHRLEENRFAPSFHCDLTEHCLQRMHRSIAYPIETCLRLLENSIREEGLFRRAAPQSKQKKFVAELDLQLIDEKMKLQDLSYDSYVVANTLKQYLRELPDCLLTAVLLPQWNEITSLSEDVRITRINELINQLPRLNYENLRVIIRFLSRVAEHSSENKMNANSLGVCIGSNLLYSKEQSSSLYINSSNIVELMIIHHKLFFPEENSSSRSTQSDAIPTVFHFKNPSISSGNSFDNHSSTQLTQSSPKPSSKHRAPPPPPVASRGMSIQLELAHIGETSTEQFLSEETTAINSPTSNIVEKGRRSNGNTPTRSERLSYRQRTSNSTKEEEENNGYVLGSPTSNDGVQIAKLIAENNNRSPKSNPNRPNKSNTTEKITQF